MVKFLVHKPVAVLMSFLGIIILGFFSLFDLPVSLMPNIDIPEITIQINVSNMSAREMENVIVKPLRNNLIQLNHLEDITTESSNETGIIKLKFYHGTRMNYSFIEVNEKIDRAMSYLPSNIERPKVIKANSIDIPAFYLDLTLKKVELTNDKTELSQDFLDFNQFVNNVVRKRIEQISEVALVDISGLTYPEIIIIPDQKKLISLGISLNDIENTIKSQNMEIGSIMVRDNIYQYNLQLNTRLNTIKDIENLIFKKSGRLFKIKDFATVKKQSQKRKGLIIANGKEAVTMAVIKRSGAQMNQLKESLKSLISTMEEDYEDIEFNISRNQTKLLDISISNLKQSLIWGIILAFLIMFLFLGDIKSPLLIGISIPISILICLLLFRVLDLSINIISLSGLVLGIGLMIDNAIIIIDNINQYRQKGANLSNACILGTNEMIRPLISSVLTTCSVFIPLMFLNGTTGALFYDQAVAVTIGLFISLMISIVLLPVLYRLFYLNNRLVFKIKKKIIKWNSIDYVKIYEKGLRYIMKNQSISIGIFLVFCFSTLGLFFLLPKDQLPALSSTETIIKIDWNEPINIDENKLRTLNLLEWDNKVKNYTAFVGSQQFLINKDSNFKSSETTIYIKTKSNDELTDLKKILKKEILQKYPLSIVRFKEVENIFNQIFPEDKAPLSAKLKAINNIEFNKADNLNEIWNSIQEAFPDEDFDQLTFDHQLILYGNAQKMAIYDVSPTMLTSTLEVAFNVKQILTIKSNQGFIPLIIGTNEKDVRKILNEALIKVNDSTYLPAKEFVSTEIRKDLKTIKGGKQGEYYSFDFKIDENKETSVINLVKSIIRQNDKFDVTFDGTIIENRKLLNEFLVVMCVTLFLLYFILAAQFESLLLPVIILLEIPISLGGAFLFLYLFNMSINLMSLIGIVVMSGIIINDSILKIDAIIQLRKQNIHLIRAIVLAGKKRLKPILMTSLTTILALIPILFSSGLGGELQTPLAIALIGGMIVGTLVSLYFIPLCYYYIAKK